MTDDRLFKRGKKDRTEQDMWTKIGVAMPKSIYKKLDNFRLEKQLPISRLAAIAIANELASRNPFNFPCDLPEVPESDSPLYLKEGRKILDFLLKLPTGMAVQTLLLFWEEVGISDKELFLKALVELIQKDLIEEYTSPFTSQKMGYAKDTIYVRAKNGDGSQQKSRFKKFEGVSLKGVRTLKDDDIDRGEE